MIRIQALVAVFLLSACSPALNWRDMALADGSLRASLPCKPELAQRAVELAGAPAELRMASCETDGATFAFACAGLADPARTGPTLTHWRAAVLAALQAPAAGQPGAPVDAHHVPAGGLDLPQSVRTQARGRMADGTAVEAHAVWFARVQGLQVRACHAMVFGAGLRPAVAEQFLAGLVLP